MTKSDYEIVAKVIAKFNRGPYWLTWVNAFCEAFREDNPRFDRDRFMDACLGLGELSKTAPTTVPAAETMPGMGTEKSREVQGLTGEAPGAVCSKCGRTVTQKEYSYGGTTCCQGDVIVVVTEKEAI